MNSSKAQVVPKAFLSLKRWVRVHPALTSLVSSHQQATLSSRVQSYTLWSKALIHSTTRLMKSPCLKPSARQQNSQTTALNYSLASSQLLISLEKMKLGVRIWSCRKWFTMCHCSLKTYTPNCRTRGQKTYWLLCRSLLRRRRINLNLEGSKRTWSTYL
jgi:hypothetical protein